MCKRVNEEPAASAAGRTGCAGGRVRPGRASSARRLGRLMSAIPVAIVTADAVEELGLKVGMPAAAVVKATSVMVEHS